MKRIKFWSPNGNEYGCFSNFSRHPVVIDGKKYRTTEHFYQSQKFAGTDPLYANKIAKAAQPKEAARLGRDKSRKLFRKDWESAKLDVMRKAIRAKADQHPDIKELLLSTGSSLIVEDSPNDYFWGVGRQGDGENWLGRLWMELRDELLGLTDVSDDEIIDNLFEEHLPTRTSHPRVWSKRKGAPTPPKGAVYVGRPSPYGNPFVLGNEEDRETILSKYEKWLLSKPELVAQVKKELRGKHLVCWCTDRFGNKLTCHADVLLRIANE